MTSLHRGFEPAAHTSGALSHRPEVDVSSDTRARRANTLMRKYEVAALLPDLSVAASQHVAPATPIFEETASAFARGTLIDTIRGPVAIEDLMPGDYIQTASGTEPVTWIGSTTYVPGRADDATTLTHLTRITEGAIRMGQPAMDLMVGPAARMMIRHDRLRSLLGQEAVLAPVQDYADGDRFLTVTPPGSVQMFHLMVPRHTTIMVGCLEMETYHPGNAASQTLGQNARALFLSMFPNLTGLGDFGETCATRTSREVIEGLLYR